jgi:hypothetical protein
MLMYDAWDFNDWGENALKLLSGVLSTEKAPSEEVFQPIYSIQ